MNNTGIVNIEIYYQQINNCQKTWTDEKYRYTKNYACYSDSAFTTQEIGATIRHEFGHALGLAHYPLKVEFGSISSSPSIMVAHSWETVHMSRITQYDIDSVKKIHPEGIANLRILEPVKETPVTESPPIKIISEKQSIPIWIKNNAKWWSDDIIDDRTFVNGIQFVEKALQWMESRCRTRSNWQGRLFDSALIYLGDDRYVWYFNVHHLICDGWSFELIYRNLADLYRLGREGRLLRNSTCLGLPITLPTTKSTDAPRDIATRPITGRHFLKNPSTNLIFMENCRHR